MPGFQSFRDYVESVVDGGQSHTSTFRKVVPVVNAAGCWFDLSTVSGHPVTNFYASTPLAAATLLAREGIQHGSNHFPKQKYLKRMTVVAAAAVTATFILTDTLLYYPFIDGDSTDAQAMDNTVTLPRYTDGAGVSAFVVAQGVYTGGAQFFIEYTNQDGVAGRISSVCTSNTAGVSGSLITSSTSAASGTFGWRIPLAQGDFGIRSVQNFTFLGANGGIFALVLCKDIGSVGVRENSVPAEKDFLLDTGLSLPQIHDGAYLNFLTLPSASLRNVNLFGSFQFVWG